MSIQPIHNASTNGLQVRVFRDKRVYTRFLAYKKHGGVDLTWIAAKQVEQELEAAAGSPLPCRRNGSPSKTPNSNSTTKIAGIMAWYLSRPSRRPVLQIAATFPVEPGGWARSRAQFSTRTHGVLGAIRKALAAREVATGICQPTVDEAWILICAGLGLPEGTDPDSAVYG
jgi:hypothetical protein